MLYKKLPSNTYCSPSFTFSPPCSPLLHNMPPCNYLKYTLTHSMYSYFYFFFFFFVSSTSPPPPCQRLTSFLNTFLSISSPHNHFLPLSTSLFFTTNMSSTSSSSTSSHGSPPKWMLRSMSCPSLQQQVVRGFSFCDLQSDTSSPGIACRYSPEEKRERIQRYRNKRSQRNFTKKIKYACRKTLADRRPRVRGRFARNEEEGEEIVKQQKQNQQQLWWEGAGGDAYFGENFWVRLLQSSSSFPFPP